MITFLVYLATSVLFVTFAARLNLLLLRQQEAARIAASSRAVCRLLEKSPTLTTFARRSR